VGGDVEVGLTSTDRVTTCARMHGKRVVWLCCPGTATSADNLLSP
jgi:hypothetical protein